MQQIIDMSFKFNFKQNVQKICLHIMQINWWNQIILLNIH